MKDIWKGNWEGRYSTRWIGSISELRQLIPTFKSMGFKIDNRGINKYLDLIVREPLGEAGLGNEVNPMEGVRIPIAAVSNGYQRGLYRGRRQGYKLVQHHELLDSIFETSKEFSDESKREQDSDFEHSRFRILPLMNLEVLEATLHISEYGARMRIEFLLPNYKFFFDNREPYVLKIICLNSVDRKFALRIGLSLYRDFSNEIFIAGFHRNHDQELEDRAIEVFLNYQFNRFVSGEWITESIPEEDIRKRIDPWIKRQGLDFQKVKHLYAKLLIELGKVEAYVRQQAGKMNYFVFRSVLSTLVHEQETLHLQQQRMAQVLDILEKISEEDQQSK